MKKQLMMIFISVFICLIYANELHIGNGVTSMQAAQNFDGTALILYVQNGSLKAINADEASRLQKIDLPEDVSGITDVQGLSLSEIDSNYFICIGKENDIYKLITIKVDYENSIELKKYALNFEQSVFSNFSLNYNDESKVYNYSFLNNNVLYNISISDNEVNNIQSISNPDDTVTSYKFYYWYEGDLIGYYISNDNTKITFLKKNGNQFEKKDINSNGVIEYVDFFYTENKDLYLMLFADNKTILYKYDNFNFEEKENTQGYAYYPELISNNSLSNKISFYDSTLTIKRNLLEDSYIASDVKIIYSDKNNVKMIYKTENKWKLLNITQNNIQDVDLNLDAKVQFANYVDDQFILFKDSGKKQFIAISMDDYQTVKKISVESFMSGTSIRRNVHQGLWMFENEKSVTLLSDELNVLNNSNKEKFILTNSKNEKSKICVYNKGSLSVNNTEVVYE